MERKQLSFSFSFPSFLKRIKTENAANESPRTLPQTETEKSHDTSNGTGRHTPDMLSTTRFPMAPPPSPAMSHQKTIGTNGPPQSPRVTPRTIDVCSTPKKVLFANSCEATPELTPLSPRPPTYVRLGGSVPPSPRRSPNRFFKLSMNKHGTQTTASSTEDFYAKENNQPTREMSSSLEDVRAKNKTSLAKSSMAASLEEFLMRKNASPRRVHFPFPSSRISTFKRPISSASPSSVDTTEYREENSLPIGLPEADQDLNAAFALSGSTLNNTFEMLQTSDTRKSFEPVASPTIAEDTSEMVRSKAEPAIEELLLKLSSSEEYNTKLISENSALKDELDAASKKSAQWEAECQKLSERLLKAENISKMLEKDSNDLTEELARCKLDKSNIEGEIVEFKAEVAALKFDLKEKDTQTKLKEAANEVLTQRLNETLEKMKLSEEKLKDSEARNAFLKTQLEDLTKIHSDAKEVLSATIANLETERVTLESELSSAREDFNLSLENLQRLLEEEKIAHKSTCTTLEEAQLKITGLMEDFEKENETLLQVQENASAVAEEKFYLETRVHTLENELRICENSFECTLDKVSILETARNNLQILLAESETKLEQALTELEQSKAEFSKLQLVYETLVQKKINEEQLEETESPKPHLAVKEEDLLNDVMVVGVVPSTASPNTSLNNSACFLGSTVEGTHYVNCESPDMFEYNACVTCYSVKIALRTLKSSVDLNTLESLDKCSVSKELVQAMAHAAESFQSHDALCNVLQDFNTKQAENQTQVNIDNQAATSHDTWKKPDGTSKLLDESGGVKRQLEDLFFLVNEVVKKSVGDYAEAMSILNELFNDVRALTMKYENTRAMVEHLERETIAYNHLVCETLTSSAVIQQELETKLVVVEKENLALKRLEGDVTENLNSVRGDLLLAGANELALKHRLDESEKAIEIYNERIIELETNLRALEDKLETAKERESKLEAVIKSLETELLAARSQVHLQDGDRIQLTKALSDIKQYKVLLENERKLHNATAHDAAECRERLAAIEQILTSKTTELEERQTRFDEQENQARSLKRLLDAANQNILVGEEKIKTLESILKTKETELSSLVHRQNLAVTELYKLREKESKCTAENEKLKRDLQLLNTRVAEAEKRYLAQINTWNCLNVTPDKMLRPDVPTETNIKQEKSSISTPNKRTVGAAVQAEPTLSNDPPSRPPSATPPMKKRLRMFNPNVQVKLEPMCEPTNHSKSKATPGNIGTSKGKGDKHRENLSEGDKTGASAKGSRTPVNLNKGLRMEEEDDEFQSSETVAPARKTYSRITSKGANTPKIDKSGKSAPSTPQSTPSGPTRKRCKMGN